MNKNTLWMWKRKMFFKRKINESEVNEKSTIKSIKKYLNSFWVELEFQVEWVLLIVFQELQSRNKSFKLTRLAPATSMSSQSHPAFLHYFMSSSPREKWCIKIYLNSISIPVSAREVLFIALRGNLVSNVQNIKSKERDNFSVISSVNFCANMRLKLSCHPNN